jgi:hypothetical protein
MEKEGTFFQMVGFILVSGYKVINTAEVNLLGLMAECMLESGLKI